MKEMLFSIVLDLLGGRGCSIQCCIMSFMYGMHNSTALPANV